MERTTNKHNPRLDEQMKREVESLTKGAPVEARAEEYRLQEAAGDDQPEVAPGIHPAPPTGMDPEEVTARSELAGYLQGCDFPAGRADLAATASDNGAPERVLEGLARLPDELRFENVQAVWEALGGSEEDRF